MEGEDEASEDDRSFSKASIPKRIAICAAGAIVNILFAVIAIFYFILLSISPDFAQFTTTPSKVKGLNRKSHTILQCA